MENLLILKEDNSDLSKCLDSLIWIIVHNLPPPSATLTESYPPNRWKANAWKVIQRIGLSIGFACRSTHVGTWAACGETRSIVSSFSCKVVLSEVITEWHRSEFCFRCFAPPPSQGHIVLCALNQHMAVRIYGAASNQSAPFRASLRRARPISAPGRDPCLWVVLRCGHVTLGKGMPTWIRGKDATWVRYDNNTTKEGRKRPNRKRHRRRCFLHRPSFGLNTVGRGRYSGSPWSAHQRHGGSVEHFFLTQPNLRPVDSFAGAVVVGRLCRVWDGVFVANAALACFGWVVGLFFRVHKLVGAPARAMFTSPAGVDQEASLQHVLTLWQQPHSGYTILTPPVPSDSSHNTEKRATFTSNPPNLDACNKTSARGLKNEIL